MKKLFIMSLALLVFTACETDLAELNKDVKNPTEVPAGTLFANATVEFFDFMVSTNVNENNFRLWAQQWAQTTYADESNYELNERNVSGRAWNTIFATVIADYKEAKRLVPETPFITDEEARNQTAIMEVMEVFAFHILTDIFADMPYSASFGDDVTPVYDNDADIYADLASRLDAAIADLSGESGLASYDLIYGGNTASWRMMANSLKLRLAIRMAEVDDAKGKAMAESAVSDGVFASSADDFELQFQNATPNTNPLWEDLVQSGRSDFIAANTMIDYLTQLNDPRVSGFYQDQFMDSATGEMVFLGGVYGDNNNYSAFSHPGTRQVDPIFPGTLLDYTEVAFLLADAASRGYAVGGEASGFYSAGIESSILEWGGTADDVAAYLAQESVAYETAEGDWRQKIATQKWIALYNRGFEAWSTWRLYDAPALNVAAQAGTLPPTRYTYPVTEYSLNEENVNAAANALGGDTKFTKVFWDAN